jgi:hypothetical protein
MGGVGSGGQNQKDIRYIEKDCIYPELGKCHICTSHSINRKGYPNFRRHNTRYLIIRYLWEEYYGDIPEGMFICHKCDTPGCINLDHVFLGTPKENSEDMKRKGRQLFGEKHNMVKLTEDQVKNIMKDSRMQKEIAVDYGISQQQVSKIKRKERWNHLWQ